MLGYAFRNALENTIPDGLSGAVKGIAEREGISGAMAFYHDTPQPEQAGTVYWPVRQVCAEGRNDWVDVPQAGQKLSDLKSPAAALEILPSGGAAAHNH